MINIAFTGGGTGGHIYPGLAVAAELKRMLLDEFPDARFFWIGSSSGLDRSIVEDAGIEFFGVPCGKLRRYFSLRTIIDFFKVIAGYFAARKILKKQKASILFSKGGFVSVPPCAAASSLRIPVFTHESDFSPGLATKLNTRYVLRTKGNVFTAYEDTSRFFSEAVRSRVIVSGNPVRSCFNSADANKGRAFLGVKENEKILLVLGGSQGAQDLNELIGEALPELIKYYTVVHQTGPAHKWEIKETEKYKPFPYIKAQMADVMAAAEIVMGRSGAGIWEWAVCGKPMLLIPLSGRGTRGDQVENAAFFQKAGAAVVMTGANVNSQVLIDNIKTFAQNDALRSSMAQASFKIGKLNGTEKIASTLLQEIKKNHKEKR